MKINPTSPLKICLVTVTLSGGGAERVAADLSIYFENLGHQVTHVVFSGTIEYEHKGTVFHLEKLKDSTNSLWSRFKRFIALYQFYKTHSFDIVIDFRNKEFYLQELIIHNFVYPKFIQTVHNYHLPYYFNKSKLFSKFLYLKNSEFVAVAKDIQEKIKNEYGLNNTTTIYNPLNFDMIDSKMNEKIELDFDYVLAAGRMHSSNVKQFDIIIKTYAESVLPSKNTKLVILGDGDLKPSFITLTNQLNLTDFVIFKGFVSNPYKYYAKAKFLIMASKHEGFPMVIIEALYCNLPVVTWNFNSGPSEIIETGYNGILVKNGDQSKLIQAMNLMVEDDSFYNKCKLGSRPSVQKFDMNLIGAQWLTYIQSKKQLD